MDSTKILSAYDAISDNYEDYSKNRIRYLEAVEGIVQKALQGSDSILDIGSGDGRRLLKISKATNIKKILAVEPSPKMATLCAKKGIPVVVASAEDLKNHVSSKYSSVLALWNVLGHIATEDLRLNALVQIHDSLTKNGIFICDVNNRHNYNSYGILRVIYRLLIDRIRFNPTRGDAVYEWKIKSKSFTGFGHLFTSNEIERLFIRAGFKILDKWAINYKTGEISKNLLSGQLMYKLAK